MISPSYGQLTPATIDDGADGNRDARTTLDLSKAGAHTPRNSPPGRRRPASSPRSAKRPADACKYHVLKHELSRSFYPPKPPSTSAFQRPVPAGRAPNRDPLPGHPGFVSLTAYPQGSSRDDHRNHRENGRKDFQSGHISIPLHIRGFCYSAAGHWSFSTSQKFFKVRL